MWIFSAQRLGQDAALRTARLMRSTFAYATVRRHGRADRAWPRAARAVRAFSGPTLVRAIARLEARLRVTLLQRSTQGVSLADAGSAYLADCLQLLASVDAAEASAKGAHVQAQGNLRVFLPLLFSRYLMAPVLADLSGAVPRHARGGALSRL